ncbi:hypothetical protein ES703_10459 [subsurface metagenome]
MAEGDIDTVIDSLQFDALDCTYPTFLHVSGNIFAVAYTGVDGDGFLITVEIDSSGNIGAAVIDSFEFDDVKGSYPFIFHVSGIVYGIAYRGVDSDGWLVTLTISAAGDIGAAVIDSWEFDGGECENPFVLHVSGDVYAIAYRNGSNHGDLVTVTISGAGVIGGALEDSFEFEVTACSHPSMIHISGNFFAIAYTGPNNNIKVVTLTISGAGVIGAAVTDTLEFDVAFCSEPVIINISGDVFAIAYTGAGNDGTIATLSISEAGDISAAVIDSFEFDEVTAVSCFIVHVSGSVYAVAYQGDGADGFIITITISDAGDIGAAVIDSFEFDEGFCRDPTMIYLSGSVYAIAYMGVDDDGWLKTVGVETVLAAVSQHLFLMGVG